MAVAHVASFSVVANSQTPTVSNVVATSGDFVIVCATLGAGISVNTIDFGASSDVFTLVPNSIADNADDSHAEIWYATGLSGTEDVTVNTTAKAQNGVGVGIFSGADTPDSAVTLVEDTRTSPSSVDVSTAGSDDFVVDAIRSPGTSLIVGANQTEIFNQAGGGEQNAASHQDGADAGVMTWTFGNTPNVAHSACRIPAAAVGDQTRAPDAGSLIVTGAVPTVERSWVAIPDAGSLTLTGSIPTLTINITIAVPVGSLVLTGLAPTVERSWVISPDTGTLVLTGEVPPIVQTFNHIRAPPVGSGVFTGFAPTRPAGLLITGYVPTLIEAAGAVIPDTGSLSLTGLAPTVVQTFSIDVPAGSGVFAGSVPALDITTTIPVGVGSLTLTGEPPSWNIGITPPTPGLVITGHAPTVERSWVVTPDAGSGVFAGSIPALNITQTLAVPAGSGVFDGKVSTLIQTFSIPIPSGSLTVSGEIPDLVETGEDETVLPGVGSLTLTGAIPTLVEDVGDRTIAIPSGSLSLSGHIPAVITTSDVVTTAHGGGWIVRDVFDTLADRKRRKLKALRERLEEIKEIPGVDGEIAQLLHKDDEKELIESSLKELENLVKSNISRAQIEQEFNVRVAKAFTRAAIQGNFSALQALDREMERVREEEAFFLLAAIMILQ